MGKPIIVFDLDGTLVDTAPDLLDSLNHTLDAGGVARTDSAGFRQFVGHGGRVMIERAYQAQRRALPTDEHDRLFAQFLEHYGSNIPGQSKPYPGVVEALERFRAAGYLLAVCTNKTEDFSKRLLVELGMSGFFAAICGQDTLRLPQARPAPSDRDHRARRRRRASKAVMVGDSRTDIDTAKAAGIPVVAVDFGYTDRHVREFEPSKVISHFDELTVQLAERLIAAAGAGQS